MNPPDPNQIDPLRGDLPKRRLSAGTNGPQQAQVKPGKASRQVIRTPNGEVLQLREGFIIRPPRPTQKTNLSVFGKHGGQIQPKDGPFLGG